MIGAHTLKRQMTLPAPKTPVAAMAMKAPPGLFGSSRNPPVLVPPQATGAERAQQARPAGMPGPVSGFGGGTFDLDGRQVTPVAQPSPDGPSANPLGGSMRRPFDYSAALATLAGEKPKVKDWQRVVAALADGIAAYNGQQPYATRLLLDRQNAYAERSQRANELLTRFQHEDWARQNEADLRAADPTTIGRNLVGYDPATGKASVLYDGPEDFDLYASQLGLEPGTPEYFKAVEDYVLRSNGPSSYERDIGLEDHRQGNRAAMERLRQSGRVGMENLRQRNRTGLEGVRQGNRLEVRRTAPARGGAARPTATDARGNKVEWDGRAWVPVR